MQKPQSAIQWWTGLWQEAHGHDPCMSQQHWAVEQRRAGDRSHRIMHRQKNHAATGSERWTGFSCALMHNFSTQLVLLQPALQQLPCLPRLLHRITGWLKGQRHAIERLTTNHASVVHTIHTEVRSSASKTITTNMRPVIQPWPHGS